MRSCLSLLVMLIIIALVLAGAYVLYTRGGGGNILRATGGDTTLTLHNETAYGLTVTMRGPKLVHFVVSPGKQEKKVIAPGKYEVEGSLSDSKTDPFHGTWTFEAGHDYNSGFTRSGGGGGEVGQLIEAK